MNQRSRSPQNRLYQHLTFLRLTYDYAINNDSLNFIYLDTDAKYRTEVNKNIITKYLYFTNYWTIFVFSFILNAFQISFVPRPVDRDIHRFWQIRKRRNFEARLAGGYLVPCGQTFVCPHLRSHPQHLQNRHAPEGNYRRGGTAHETEQYRRLQVEQCYGYLHALRKCAQGRLDGRGICGFPQRLEGKANCRCRKRQRVAQEVQGRYGWGSNHRPVPG